MNNKEREAVTDLINLLKNRMDCPQCRRLSAQDRINQMQIESDKADLRDMRLACRRIFEGEGLARVLAIKHLYTVLEKVYGKKVTYGWSIKDEDKQAYNAFLAQNNRCQAAADRVTATCAQVKALLAVR